MTSYSSAVGSSRRRVVRGAAPTSSTPSIAGGTGGAGSGGGFVGSGAVPSSSTGHSGTTDGRPPLHTRQHSANTAGDVFAMLGGGGTFGGSHHLKQHQQSQSHSKQHVPDRAAAVLPPHEAPSSSSVGAGGGFSRAHQEPFSVPAAVEDEPTTSSSSSPSTPSSSQERRSYGKPSAKRFQVYYSKPALLKLWSRDRTAKIQLEDLYSAVESPGQSGEYNNEGYGQGHGRHHHHQHQHHQYNTNNNHNSHHHERPQYSKRISSTFSNSEYTGALGRLPTGTINNSSNMAIGGGSRRSMAGTGGGSMGGSGGDRYGSVGIQGGVLPGGGGFVGGSDQARRRTLRDDGAGQADGERASPFARSARTANATAASGAIPGATSASLSSNRWRHLQPDDDSQSASGASSKDDQEDVKPDPWGTVDGSWAPTGHQHDRLREERAAYRSAAVASASSKPGTFERAGSLPAHDWDEGGHSTGPISSPAPADAVKEQQPARSVPSTASNPALFFDDLLAPSPRPTAMSSEPHSIATAPGGSAGANRLASPLSMLNLGRASPQPASSGTPTRQQTAEGLEILARRSPVQEVSMAHLQSQAPLPSPSLQRFPQPPLQQPQLPREDPNTIFWNYRDPSGQIQGPFSAPQMQEWYGQGFFTETLLVKRVESSDFETLGALVIRIGDAKQPFLSSPAPRFYGPPGMMGIGQPPISHSPIGYRTASPAAWHQHVSQPSSRNASISSHAGAGGIDIFGHHQQQQQVQQQQHHPMHAGHANIHSPQPTLPSSGSARTFSQNLPALQVLQQQQQQQGQQHHQPQSSAAVDPWADTLPVSSPAISRSNSTRDLSGTSIEHPIQPITRTVQQQSSSAVQSPISAHPGVPEPQQQQPEEQVDRSPWNVSTSAKQIEAQQANEGDALAFEQPSSQPAEKDSSSGEARNEGSSIETPDAAKKSPAIEVELPAVEPVSTTTVKSEATKAKKAAKVASEPKKPATAAAEKDKAEQSKDESTSEAPESAITQAPRSASATPVSKIAPWAKASMDEGKSSMSPSTSGTALSLREIQAKEEKEAAVRKAQEKKMQAAQLAAQEAALAERLAREAAEALPASSRWADTSSSSYHAAPSPSAGPATTGSALGSPAVSSASGSAAAPWAKPALASSSSGTKKTLKEIQEEEARRKKAAAAAAATTNSSGALAAGKGYAGSIGQAQSRFVVPSASAGGAWTTVGAKPATPATSSSVAAVGAAGARAPGLAANASAKTITPTSVSASMATRLASSGSSGAPSVASPKPVSFSATPANATSTTASSAPSNITKVVPNGRSTTPAAAAKNDDTVPASPELLRWCREALRGLDIPVDDFIQMLLSFPVPLDKSVRELISDSVYSSSRTLDGRHFADAFADRRQADVRAMKAAAANGATSTTSSSFGTPSKATALSSAQPKVFSMADAIRSTPAPKKEPENFKIVTKSKGKGRK